VPSPTPSPAPCFMPGPGPCIEYPAYPECEPEIEEACEWAAAPCQEMGAPLMYASPAGQATGCSCTTAAAVAGMVALVTSTALSAITAITAISSISSDD
jgi:hypothetical protein